MAIRFIDALCNPDSTELWKCGRFLNPGPDIRVLVKSRKRFRTSDEQPTSVKALAADGYKRTHVLLTPMGPDPEPEPLSDDSEFVDSDRPTDTELAMAAAWDPEELGTGSVDESIADTLDAHESIDASLSGPGIAQDESAAPDAGSVDTAPESGSEGNVDDSRTVPYGWASIEADDDESDEGPSDPPSVPRIADLDPFTMAYLEMALDLDADGLSLDDIADASLAEHAEACRQFQEANAADLEGRNLIRAGQDFWLTRNRHGAGYWDGDYPDGAGRRLTDAAHVWGSSDAYVGDDGYVHLT
jgi:hypothetical protein